MARLSLLSAVCLSLLSNLATAAILTVAIPPSNILPNPSLLPPSTHATLHASGSPLNAPLSRSNTFTFKDIPSGSYLLSIHCRDYSFEPLRVDVGTTAAGVEWLNAWQTFRGNEWDNKGEKRAEVLGHVGDDGKKLEASASVNAVVLGGKQYYQQREGFSVLSLFKNPMILMAVVSLGLIVGMPYLLENMDPEAKAEFEEMQKKSPIPANPASSIQNFDLAAWMAGTPPSSSKPVEEPIRPQQSGGRRKG